MVAAGGGGESPSGVAHNVQTLAYWRLEKELRLAKDKVGVRACVFIVCLYVLYVWVVC